MSVSIRAQPDKPDVLVIGAGVAGLTTAVCLAEAGAGVRVVANQRPEHTTSAAAGAVWAPYWIGGDSARIDRWSQRSLEVFTALARADRAGVRLLTSMEVSGRPVAAPEWAPLVAGVRAATADELPSGYAYGYRLSSPLSTCPPTWPPCSPASPTPAASSSRTRWPPSTRCAARRSLS